MMRALNLGATYVKGLLMLKKIIDLMKNPNVIIAKSLAMFKKIVGTEQVNKHTSPKKMKTAKAHSMHVKPWRSKEIMYGTLIVDVATT